MSTTLDPAPACLRLAGLLADEATDTAVTQVQTIPPCEVVELGVTTIRVRTQHRGHSANRMQFVRARSYSLTIHKRCVWFIIDAQGFSMDLAYVHVTFGRHGKRFRILCVCVLKRTKNRHSLAYQEQLSVSYELRISELLVRSYAIVEGSDLGDSAQPWLWIWNW